jgi:hypothetical protein
VPADILVFHAFVVGLTTETKKNADGDPVTRITDPGWLKAMLIIGCVWAIVEYWLAHHPVQRTWDTSDYIRAVIPAAAFVLWTMLQSTTAFDAWFPNFGDPGRTILAALLVVVLGLLAKTMSDVAGKAKPE